MRDFLIAAFDLVVLIIGVSGWFMATVFYFLAVYVSVGCY